MIEQNHPAPADQSDAQRRAQFAAPWQVFLRGHHCPERQHPGDIPNPDGEHQEHQRPAAADAKKAVMDSQQKCVAPLIAAAPVFGDETQGSAALVQAAVFQAAKLKARRPRAAWPRRSARRSLQARNCARQFHATTNRLRARQYRSRSIPPSSPQSPGLKAVTDPRRCAVKRRKISSSGKVVGNIMATVISVQPIR